MHQKCQQGKTFSTLNDISALEITFMWTSGFYSHEHYMYILTEGGRSFKTLLKENYGQLLLIYLKMLSMGLNMILIVLMETLDFPKIRADLIDKTFLAI